MAEPRKVDQLAGKGSIADKLRRRRLAVEAGDLEAAQRISAGSEKPEDAQYGAPADGDGDSMGAPTRKKMMLLKDLLIGKKK